MKPNINRFWYSMPAVIVTMFYFMLALLVGGIGGFQLIAWMYIGLPILAAVLLIRHKWWGCIPGILMGVILFCMGSQYTGQIIDVEQILGIAFVVYYIAMGKMCHKERKDT